MKTLKSNVTLVESHCMNYTITPKVEQKSFRYNHYSQEPRLFECDEEFQENLSNPMSKLSSERQTCTQTKSSNTLEAEHLESFSKFRRHFYDLHHQLIKSSFKNQPNIEIINIRLAPINESVQNDFMQRLNNNPSYFPQLVYHGTRSKYIQSILRYGFLIPNRPHPSNTEAPIILSQHDEAYGSGIYCSRTAVFSLSYVINTTTLLVCAAIPKRKKSIKTERCHGDVLVLSHVSQIIPLFLVDFKYSNILSIDRPWFNEQQQTKIEGNKQLEKDSVASRKYLRKILDYINDDKRKNNQYQLRAFDL